MNHNIAIVTGASRGIGRAIALRYAKEGYHLAICCKNNSSALEDTAREIRSLGVDCLTYQGDMGNAVQVEEFFAKVRETFHTVHVLVNNAGISHIGLMQDLKEDVWQEILSSNLSSAFFCCQKAIPFMLQNGAGKIINISSVWGQTGASTEVAYSTTKGGINALTKALAKELAPSNIQVNAIACGLIDTDMNSCFSEEEISTLIEEIPAGRIGTPEEVAGLVFSLSKEHNYLTGQVISLDGGWI